MRRIFFLIILLQLVVSCAPFPLVRDTGDLLAYLPQAGKQTLLAQHHPVFVIENQKKPYNRIGTPKAELTEGMENIYVDPNQATIYTEIRPFKTAKGTYTNLIYRIHFSETPFGLIPFQIGAGKNVGLFVIVTLNSSNQPVLYTTVHTCGCYLAFLPTTFLPQGAFPPEWPKERQVIYSMTLPSLLDLETDDPRSSHLFILLKDASHRVTDVRLAKRSKAIPHATDTINSMPLSVLESLPVQGTDRTTSFYEMSGPRTGYVKNSHKPLERILMSWWALDWSIGDDKRLGKDGTEPPRFFTSLKPWARTESDMRDFPTFLSYWGWKL